MSLPFIAVMRKALRLLQAPDTLPVPGIIPGRPVGAVGRNDDIPARNTGASVQFFQCAPDKLFLIMRRDSSVVERPRRDERLKL